jgi:hypothetical protein
MKCAACTRSVRTTQRAVVLSGPGRVKNSRVCRGCARLGWLLVFAEPTTQGRKRAQKRSELTDYLLETAGALVKTGKLQP